MIFSFISSFIVEYHNIFSLFYDNRNAKYTNYQGIKIGIYDTSVMFH